MIFMFEGDVFLLRDGRLYLKMDDNFLEVHSLIEPEA